MSVRVALVGGPMYDHLYDEFSPGDVEVVVHADHPTLNRTVAGMLDAGERIDLLATHSKYAPSQARWLHPLDDMVDEEVIAALAPGAVDLCRFDGRQWCLPRLVDVRILWVRRDRVDRVPATWADLLDDGTVLGFPGRESGLFGTFFEIVVGLGGSLFDGDGRPTMDGPESVEAVRTLVALARRAPDDLPDWHYDEVDAALLGGRVDMAAAWPGGWGAIGESALADVLEPHPYPAGPATWVSYAGCHAWAIPATCDDVDGALALLGRLLGAEAQGRDAAGGSMCAHQGALAAVEPDGPVDARRLGITRRTIDEAMITYPSLVRFPEVEDAGWAAIQAALRGEVSPGEAVAAIQASALAALE